MRAGAASQTVRFGADAQYRSGTFPTGNYHSLSALVVGAALGQTGSFGYTRRIRRWGRLYRGRRYDRVQNLDDRLIVLVLLGDACGGTS